MPQDLGEEIPRALALRVGEEFLRLVLLDDLAGLAGGLGNFFTNNAGTFGGDENLPLVLRAWEEQEPFAHNGKFSQYPAVNIWPRPLQARPPVWITGIGNPATMQFTFDTPVGAPVEQQCGRVAFTEYHTMEHLPDGTQTMVNYRLRR